MNVVVAAGKLARPPQHRLLPSGDALVAYELTVPRPDAPAETVPVVWPQAPARALELAGGEEVVVLGRVRRRFFRASGATQSRTEIVAEAVVATRHRRRVESMLAAARSQLESLR